MHLLKYTHFEHDILVNLTNVTTGLMKMEGIPSPPNFTQAALQSVLLTGCPRQSLI